VALTKSRNLVSVRLLQAIGVPRAREYCQRFGFPASKLPNNLSLALGSGAVTPLELITGYAVLANGGYRVEPHLVTRVLDQQGEVVWAGRYPQVISLPAAESIASLDGDGTEGAFNTVENGQDINVGHNGSADKTTGDSIDPELVSADRIVPEAEFFLINSILRDVIKKGTGRKALRLGRGDLAGKTGTTNNQLDAWFSGYGAGVVTTTWVGFDKPKSLGKLETGARAALPVWIDYMEQALKGIPEQPLVLPADVVSARIRADTGQLAGADEAQAIFEYFRLEDLAKLKTQAEEPSADSPDRANIF
jgi:penicillin-binding protein 1A